MQPTDLMGIVCLAASGLVGTRVESDEALMSAGLDSVGATELLERLRE